MCTLHATSQAILSPYYAFHIICSVASWRHVIYVLSNLSRTTPAICHLSPVESVISPNVNMGSLGLSYMASHRSGLILNIVSAAGKS